MPPQEPNVDAPFGAQGKPAPPQPGAAPPAEPEVQEDPITPEEVAAAAELAAEAEAGVLEDDALAELRERAAKADGYLDLAQRTKADFENFRKRMTRDLQAAEARGTGRLAKELLPALDNLEHALAAVEASDADPDQHVTQGFRLVQSELAKALNRTGIEGFAPKGEQFDPSEHEAVAQHPVEGAEPGTVVEVLQAGYRLNGAILRPARVVVAG